MFTLRRYGGTSSTGSPSSMIWPLVGVSKPASILSVVVLPQPLGPSRLKNSPLAIVRLTSVDHRGVAEALADVVDADRFAVCAHVAHRLLTPYADGSTAT